jgi:glycerate kinase
MACMPLVVLAPDKFKGSLSGAEVAAALRRGLVSRRPDLDVRELLVADGGEGTIEAALAAGYAPVAVTATGPTGEQVGTRYARRGSTAVVEMADVSGLGRLPRGQSPPGPREARSATSRGTGEVIRAAVEAGCDRVVLGIGGSASTDGGAGLVQALGGRLLGADRAELAPGGAALSELVGIDLSGLLPRLAAVELVVACDVDNPLTGAAGAAAVYGPQKGAAPEDVEALDAALRHWADLVARVTGHDRRDEPGAGAAGGVGFAALALLNAELRPGIDLMLELVDFEAQLRDADLVITGEGSLDLQSLHGKAPVGVARAARAQGIRVVAVCGRRLISDDELFGTGIAEVHALVDLEPDPARSIANAAALLEVVGARVAEAMRGS